MSAEKKAPSKSLAIDEQLRRAIEESGLSPHAIALSAELDPGIVARFASGRRDVMLGTAARIASALGLRLVEGPRTAKARR